jgi:hypothetical protein
MHKLTPVKDDTIGCQPSQIHLCQSAECEHVLFYKPWLSHHSPTRTSSWIKRGIKKNHYHKRKKKHPLNKNIVYSVNMALTIFCDVSFSRWFVIVIFVQCVPEKQHSFYPQLKHYGKIISCGNKVVIAMFHDYINYPKLISLFLINPSQEETEMATLKLSCINMLKRSVYSNLTPDFHTKRLH